MNYVKVTLIIMVALAVSACGWGRSSTSTAAFDQSKQITSPGAVGSYPLPAAAPATAAGAAEGPALASGGQAGNEQAPNDQQGFSRLVIKNANLSLQVEDVHAAEAAVRAKVNQLGGYIVQVQTNGPDEYLSTNITFRVPADRFDMALSGVEGLAKKVLSRSVSGDDVTEEFVDLESRMRNLEATRDRLLTFLEKAEKVEDALAVNTSLTQVQGEIEQIRGRMQYLKQSAALSTIVVALQPVPAVQPIIEEGWQPVTVARAALRSLVEFGQSLANVVIVALVWSPVWGLLLLAGLWARRKLVRRGQPG